MTVWMSHAAVGTIVLALGLASPIVAQATCIDGPCQPENSSQSAGQDGSLEWQFKSNYDYKLALKFYSQTRRGHVWPNAGEHYVLDDYDTHTYTLGCSAGELICFGAWSTGDSSTYWGIGEGGTQACDNCCFTCGDNPRRQVLNQ